MNELRKSRLVAAIVILLVFAAGVAVRPILIASK
jgi:hypothetical protein